MPIAIPTTHPSHLCIADLRRATYYLRRDQIRSLRLVAATLERNISDVVREAVDGYLAACAKDLEAQALAGRDQGLVAVPGRLASGKDPGVDSRQLSMFPEARVGPARSLSMQLEERT